ncbi:MAG: hypothetical protein Q7R41_18565 [Phycisphaerales bacterium]|nr:hypothetical protein [Phycisphaerales bacterium]
MFRGISKTFAGAGIAILFAAVPVLAQDAARQAQNKLLAKRAAEADCYRKLAESIYGVQINSETYVRDFITESDTIRAGVDTFIRGIRLGPPQYYEDGACQVEGEVSVAKLITELKQLHSEHYKGKTVTTTDIEKITETVKTDVIKAIGMGAPRPELPPDLPAGIEKIIEPLPQGYTPPPVISVPAIWKAVGPQARLMAERAGEVDAMRKLLEQIKGLRLTSDTLVRDFITESDEIRTQASGIVVGAAKVATYLHDDELIAEVTMEIPVERVITKIKELHSQHYHGNKVTTTDITKLQESVQRDMIRATGAGVPRPDLIAKVAAEVTGFQQPEWTARSIDATGQGTDPALDTAQGKLKAARAAELDGMRKLAEQVFGLEINSGTTVRDFVTQHDTIRTQVDSILVGATSGEPRFEGGVATVTVSLPAADVWRVVHSEMTIVQRRR